VGSVGHENRLDYTAIGSVVNLASRLCSTARDGQILVDPRAAEEVGSEVSLESLGRLPLKGFDEQVLVYAVAGEPAPDICQG
jgi:class 3 adenylate cyclase